MQLEMLYAKIHRATVTEADLNYVGSIGIDKALVKAAGLLEGQRVLVANLKDGARFETYVIPLDTPGAVVTNGAAAHLAKAGDKVIIMAFAQMAEAEAKKFRPKVVLVDDKNRITEVRGG